MKKKVSQGKKKITQLKKKISQLLKKYSRTRKVKKGFTLIELLAVITIMGVLLLIAISGVSVLVTRSRIRTLAITIDSYAESVAQEMLSNTELYKFNERENTIYAIPIECVLLEEGGTNPFGEWLQASDAYWAYVLVQWDYDEEKYIYGFTFKDSGGYGLYPTSMEKLNENKSKIKYRVELRKPESGSYLNVAEEKNWTGFNLNDETMLIVLEASKEGQSGDGETTCTLCQKGSNYDENDDDDKLLYNIVKNSVLTDQGKQYTGKGYNSSPKNVYFYNDPASNNVLFADYCWKVIRTTGTGGVKLMYNGEPVDGVCDNYGSETQIGTTDFSEYSSSLSDVGYMGGVAYDYARDNLSSTTHASLFYNVYIGQYTTYRYYKNVSYSNGTYNLSGTSFRGQWRSYYNSAAGYYTCFSNSSSCANPYYIIKGVNKARAIGYYLRGGKLKDDYTTTVTLAPDIISNDDGTYTLKDYSEVSFEDLYQNYNNYNNYYVCSDHVSKTCDNVRYITNFYGDSYYAVSLKTYMFGSSYVYNNGNYVLKNGKKYPNILNDELENRHYTCFNVTGECDELYYIYNYDSSGSAYYLTLKNGVSIENATTAMLTSNVENSNAKSLVESWYEATMTEYTSKLEDTVYCNNRSVSTFGGWDSNSADFSTHLKFYSFDNDDLTCSNKSDQFTVSSSIGNGKLKYPVGMITAPEAKLWGSNSTGASYWTMTPFGYGEAAGHVFKVFNDGKVDFDRVTYSNGVRPVVSLKPGTEVSGGEGTLESPYVIE